MNLKKTIMFYMDILADQKGVVDLDIVMDHVKQKNPQCNDQSLDNAVEELKKEGYIAFIEWPDLSNDKKTFSRLSGHDRFYRKIKTYQE